MGEQLALLAGSEGQSEVGELAERGRSPRIDTHLVGESHRDGALQYGRCAAQAGRKRHHERLADSGAGQVAKHDRPIERAAGVSGKVERAGVAAAAAAGGDNDDGARGLTGGQHACQLKQHRGP